MKRYVVQRAYVSGGFGDSGPLVLAKGQVFEAEDGLAAWLERDAPGLLEEIKQEQRQVEVAAEHRMVVDAQNRAEEAAKKVLEGAATVAEKEASKPKPKPKAKPKPKVEPKQEEITKATYKAVKDK